MKTLVFRSFLFNVLMGMPLFLFSQGGGIMALSVVPANPNPEDSVSIIADVWLSSGSCWLDNHNGNISQDTLVEINGTFESGMLTVICNTSDTFKLGRLEPGNYHVTYNMHYTNFPTILDTEVLTFSVSGSTTSIRPLFREGPGLCALLSPGSGQVMLNYKLKAGEKATILRVYALDGRLLHTLSPVTAAGSMISMPIPASPGIYFYSLETSENHRYSCKLAIP
jgi:hypothetical protein